MYLYDKAHSDISLAGDRSAAPSSTPLFGRPNRRKQQEDNPSGTLFYSSSHHNTE